MAPAGKLAQRGKRKANEIEDLADDGNSGAAIGEGSSSSTNGPTAKVRRQKGKDHARSGQIAPGTARSIGPEAAEDFDPGDLQSINPNDDEDQTKEDDNDITPEEFAKLKSATSDDLFEPGQRHVGPVEFRHRRAQKLESGFDENKLPTWLKRAVGDIGTDESSDESDSDGDKATPPKGEKRKKPPEDTHERQTNANNPILKIQESMWNCNPYQEDDVILKRLSTFSLGTVPHSTMEKDTIAAYDTAGAKIGKISREKVGKLIPLIADGIITVSGRVMGLHDFDLYSVEVFVHGPTERKPRNEVDKLLAGLGFFTERNRQISIWRGRERLKSDGLKEDYATAQRVLLLSHIAANSSAGDRVLMNFDGRGRQYFVAPDGRRYQSFDQDFEEYVNNAQYGMIKSMTHMKRYFGHTESSLVSMESAPQPERILTKLLPHQLMGLKWMLDQENTVLPVTPSNEPIQLWKYDSASQMYRDLASGKDNILIEKPDLVSGGILADDMGLGKTLQAIALILADRRSLQDGENRTTLVVCPTMVVSNWSKQIEEHVVADRPLKVLRYQRSAKKPIGPADLVKYDVVLVTYGSLQSEWKLPANSKEPAWGLRSKGLYSIKWRRVILDEAHTIRAIGSASHQACIHLEAISRWALTGTPVVNKIENLYPIFQFLKLPTCVGDGRGFEMHIERGLKLKSLEAGVLLRATLATHALRRKKGMHFIDRALSLPPIQTKNLTLQMSPFEMTKYNEARELALSTLRGIERGGIDRLDPRYKMSNLLRSVIDMRKTCSHWLLYDSWIERLLEIALQATPLEHTPENKNTLQDMLQLVIEAQDECAVCLEPLINMGNILTEPVITTCMHAFCRRCIERTIEEQHRCPLCRHNIPNTTQLVGPRPEVVEDEEVNGEEDNPRANDDNSDEKSTKVEAIVDLLKQTAQRGDDTKTIVFSSWNPYLALLQTALRLSDLPDSTFVRIDSSIPQVRREAALSRFEKDPSCTILLASYGMCGVGLNLIAANHIILADSWWTTAVEDQAITRVHRLGQKREVKVVRMIMKDTVEEKVLELVKDRRGNPQGGEQEAVRNFVQDRGNERLADIKTLLS
jgi:SWI/SNF-related matrix-associated actin-dependent regulator of chromatin subfamily A3